MTSTPTPTDNCPLGLATLNTLLRSTLDALPHHPQATADEIAQQREAAMLVVAALGPRDPVEAVIAGRYVAAHHAMMEAFRCAAQPDLPPALVLRFQGKAIGLARMTTVALRELERRQEGPPMRVVPLPPVPESRPQPAPAAQTAPAPQPAAGARPAQAVARPAPSAPSSPLVHQDPIHHDAPGPRPAAAPAARPAPLAPAHALVCERVRPPNPAQPVATPNGARGVRQHPMHRGGPAATAVPAAQAPAQRRTIRTPRGQRGPRPGRNPVAEATPARPARPTTGTRRSCARSSPPSPATARAGGRRRRVRGPCRRRPVRQRIEQPLVPPEARRALHFLRLPRVIDVPAAPAALHQEVRRRAHVERGHQVVRMPPERHRHPVRLAQREVVAPGRHRPA